MENKKDIVIDWRVVAVPFAALLIYAGARHISALRVTDASFRKSVSVSTETPEGSMSVSLGGVDLTIEEIRRVEGKTLVAVAMSNHQYDLTDPTIMDRTTLAAVRAEKFEVSDARMGGHHSEGKFWFDGELDGLLKVGVAEGLELEIRIP